MSGAELLGDALREMLEDASAEDRHHRSTSFVSQVEIEEIEFRTIDQYAAWRVSAREVIDRSLKNGNFLIWVGGNHLSILPLYEELAARKGSLVVQLDAHLDLYHLRDCVTELSHGNFLRRLDPLPAIVNVGHRDLFLLPNEIAKYYRQTMSACRFAQDEIAGLESITSLAASAPEVLVDIDMDVLDPAYFPAVVDALPFGLTPHQLIRVLQAIDSSKLRAVAISEFDPGRDVDDRSLGLLVWLIEWILLRKYETNRGRI